MNFKNKRIGFRVDGSKELGLGHIFRCVALADSLHGGDISFWVKDNPDVRGILKGKDTNYLLPDLTCKSETDFLIREIIKKKIDALITDLLVYPKGYLEKLKQTHVKLITFHELETDISASDILINSNTFKGFDNCKDLVTGDKCFGPSYVVIRDGIRKIKPVRPSKQVKTILISMGGSDPHGITLRVVNNLISLSAKPKIIIHAGPAFKYHKELFAMLGKGSDGFTVRENVPELAELMVNADVAISCGGITMYELCYLGIPSIILSLNNRQHEFADELDKNGAVKSLGLSNNIGKNALRKIIERVCNSYEERAMMAENAKKLIDGKGVDRIKAKIWHLICNQNELVG